MPMIQLENTPDGTILPVRAHAGARRTGILGERGGALRVAVSAAPEKGKANRAIVAVLSKAFGVSKSSIELLGGTTSPQKRFLLRGLPHENARQILKELVETP